MKLADHLSATNQSPREFAHRIGVSPEAVRLYLKGERRPRREVLKAIYRETDGAVTANDFFTEAA